MTSQALLLILSLFSSFWEVRTGHVAQVTPPKRASPIVSVSSHPACKQKGSSEFHPFEIVHIEESVILSCTESSTF